MSEDKFKIGENVYTKGRSIFHPPSKIISKVTYYVIEDERGRRTIPESDLIIYDMDIKDKALRIMSQVLNEMSFNEKIDTFSNNEELFDRLEAKLIMETAREETTDNKE